MGSPVSGQASRAFFSVYAGAGLGTEPAREGLRRLVPSLTKRAAKLFVQHHRPGVGSSGGSDSGDSASGLGSHPLRALRHAQVRALGRPSFQKKSPAERQKGPDPSPLPPLQSPTKINKA